MDKSWITKSRYSPKYEEGVANFLNFAKVKFGENAEMPCPCRNCGNIDTRTTEEIKGHLYFLGFEKSYISWTWHGEKGPNEAFTSAHVDESVEYNMDILDDAEDTTKLVQAAHEQHANNPEKIKSLLEDAEEPVYKGCSKFTKLSATVALFNLKAKGGWSDTSFSRLLKFLGDILPKDENVLPKSMNEVKKTLSVYGMKYQKIHACPNDCILYRKMYKDATTCPTCGESRYKVNQLTNEQRKGVPAKVLWYFPPIPRFQKMFLSKESAKNLTWHADERELDGTLRHPADSPASGSFVAWPKQFVMIDDEEESTVVTVDVNGENQLKNFAKLVTDLLDHEFITIPMEKGVFEEAMEFCYISKSDLMDLCGMNQLELLSITAYQGFLYGQFESSRERYRFANPANFHRFGEQPDNTEGKILHMVKRLKAVKKGQLIFLPYNPMNHWVLMIIDISSYKVYWLDSMHGSPDIDIKYLVNRAIKTTTAKPGKKQAYPNWELVQVPKQKGFKECGVYVMRFMKHFMEDFDQSTIINKMTKLKNIHTYTEKELNDTRLELVNYLLYFMNE